MKHLMGIWAGIRAVAISVVVFGAVVAALIAAPVAFVVLVGSCAGFRAGSCKTDNQ